MALDFIEGFDHMADDGTQYTRKGWEWLFFGDGNQPGRRAGSQAYTCTQTARMLWRAITESQWITAGAAYLLPSQAVTGTGYFMYLGSSDTSQCGLFLNADNTVSFRRGTTTLGTSTATLADAAWNYVEMRVKIHATTGEYEVRLNGVNILSDTNVNTDDATTESANQIAIIGRPAISSSAVDRIISIDDFYVGVETGFTFLGDVRVDTLMPTAEGNYSQFTPLSGTNNALMVDEATPDDDTTYVESSTVGQRDTYEMEDLSHTPASIFGVQSSVYARKVDSGARELITTVRSGTTDYDSATNVLATSYLYYTELHATDPDTAAAWTISGVNAVEVGQKVEA
jgi:hypothetical protein